MHSNGNLRDLWHEVAKVQTQIIEGIFSNIFDNEKHSNITNWTGRIRTNMFSWTSASNDQIACSARIAAKREKQESAADKQYKETEQSGLPQYSKSTFRSYPKIKAIAHG